MTRQRHARLSLLAALVTAPGAACSGADADAPLVVTSSDGRVTLEVPAGAAPAGTDVRITPQATTLEGVVGGVRYDFEPDGLVFSEPATVRFELPDGFTPPEGGLAVAKLVTVSPDGNQPVDALAQLEATLDGRRVVAALSGFSSYSVVYRMPDLGTSISAPSTVWDLCARTLQATWSYTPPVIFIGPGGMPWPPARIYFERAARPLVPVSSPPPPSNEFRFVGSAFLTDRALDVGGNPVPAAGQPDFTFFLRAFNANYAGSTLHVTLIPTSFPAVVGFETRPPNPVGDLRARVVDPSTIDLSWRLATNNPTRYRITRAPAWADGQPRYVDAGRVAFTDPDAPGADTSRYAYDVTSETIECGGARRLDSATIRVVCDQNLCRGANQVAGGLFGLSATVLAANVSLTWSASAAADRFTVERRVPGGAWSQIGEVPSPGTQFVDANVAPGSYEYRVTPVNAAGAAPGSNVSVVVGGVGGPLEVLAKAGNADPGDRLGAVVALSGDGLTLAAGVPLEDSAARTINGDGRDNGAADAGAVIVYRKTAGVWAEEAYLKAANADANDWFGASVALSQDGSTLAVGAPFEDSAATGVGGDASSNAALESGAVYIFRRTGTTWTQEAYVKASNGETFDRFGRPVALSRDGTVLAVGAPQESSPTGGVASGAIYVFRRSGGLWAEEAYLKAQNLGPADNGGSALALSGDGGTVALGAYRNDGPAPLQPDQRDSGAVTVFRRGPTGWAEEAYLRASNASGAVPSGPSPSGDDFGAAVALSDDGSTLAVGATQEDSDATGVGGDELNDRAPYAGAVYLFRRAGSAWSQEAYVKASNTESADVLGTSIALSANGATLVVGAFGEDSSATGLERGPQAPTGPANNNSALGSGAVYAFRRTGGVWAQEAYVKPSATVTGDGFGASVALSADGQTLSVGTPGDGSSASGARSPGSGAVHVYRL